jgi:ribosomal protein L37AE/L43A
MILDSTQHPLDWNSNMAKGNLCPDCGTYTLQPISTNWLQCSNCNVKRPA